MPAVELSSPASTLTFHEVLVRWGPAYLAQWGSDMPARQREVLATILSCRTPRRGGQLWRCPEHPHYRYVYHSCNDRHCPQCGHGEAQEWLDRQFHRLLLPVEYFLILSLIHISEPTRLGMISYAVFCLKKKKKKKNT